MQERKSGFHPPKIRGDQRLALFGKTGSGKSFLARYLLKLASSAGWRIVIVDPKKDWQGRGLARRSFGGKKPYKLGTVDHPVLVQVFNPALQVQIFQPVSWDASMERLCQDVMAVGNTIIYYDEITQLASANQVPMGLKLIWTQGRSINVGGWAGSQRPVMVPEIIKSQAELWFIFRLTKKEDREAVAGYIPVEETPDFTDRLLPYRYFWYYDDSLDRPLLVKPLKLVKAGTRGSHSE